MPYLIPQAHSRSLDTRTNNISAPSSLQAFGVVTDDGAPDPESFHWRGGRCLADEERLRLRYEGAEKFSYLDGKWFYGGIFYPHFGHFLTETIHRIRQYVQSKDSYDGLIFLKSPMKARFDYDPFSFEYVEFFLREFFGLNLSNIRVVDDFMKIEALEIGKLESQLGKCPETPYLRFLKKQETDLSRRLNWSENRSRAIFLSRRNYLKSGRMLGMSAVENVLSKNGIEIFEPEKSSIQDQIKNLRESKIVYCEAGSALHLLDGIGPQDLDLVIFSRRGSDGNYWKNLYKCRVRSVQVFDNVLPIHAYLGTSAGEGHSLAHPKRLSDFLLRAQLNFDQQKFITELVHCTNNDLSNLGYNFLTTKE